MFACASLISTLPMNREMGQTFGDRRVFNYKIQ